MTWGGSYYRFIKFNGKRDLKMIPDEYVIFMEALRTVNPTLFNISKYATKPKDQIMTFEDCARVEKEINDALSGVVL